MRKKETSNIRFWMILVMISVLTPIFLAEFIIRAWGVQQTYSEKIGQGYSSYYGLSFDGYRWCHKLNSEFILDHGDFKFLYRTNEYGHREKRIEELDFSNAASRVLVLGDSFTEGVGAPYDSTWPRSFEHFLSNDSQFDVQYVYNAGVSGSDPFFDFQFLRTIVPTLKPTQVIQCINSSDITDYIFRGGKERFIGGRTTFRKGPWWKRVYQYSHLFRMVVHSNNIGSEFLTESEREKVVSKSLTAYHQLLEEVNQYCLSRSIELIIVYLPVPAELTYGIGDFLNLVYLDSLAQQSDLVTINLHPSLSKSMGLAAKSEYSFKNDGHYNSDGYWMIGELIADKISEYYRES